jgi:hypothetical protein
VADHNDPNAVNSIFSDIDVSAEIYAGVGGRDFLERAKKLNPFVERFHLHH